MSRPYHQPLRDLIPTPIASPLGAGEAIQEVNREIRARLAALDTLDPSQARPVAKPNRYNVAFFNFD